MGVRGGQDREHDPAQVRDGGQKVADHRQSGAHPLTQLPGLAGVGHELGQTRCAVSESGCEAGQELRPDRRQITDDLEQRCDPAGQRADGLAGLVEDQPDVVDRAALAGERSGVAGGVGAGSVADENAAIGRQFGRRREVWLVRNLFVRIGRPHVCAEQAIVRIP